jgi:predicted nucleotidyltransferase
MLTETFESDRVLVKILDELQNDYDCHSAILYGSRARGDANETSDYDIIGLRDKGPNVMVAKQIEGKFSDAFVYEDTYPEKHLQEFLRVRGAKVLFQRGNHATKLISQVEALYRKGPVILRDDELQQRRTWIEKTYQRVLRTDIEGLYRRHMLVFNLLEDYFALRGLWYRGPKESFRYLKDNDPKAYELFENAMAQAGDLKNLKRLCEHVARTL